MANPKQPDADSDDDAFERAMEGVQPLEPARPDPYRRRHRPVPLNLPVGDEASDKLADLAIETGEYLEFRRPGVQKRVFRDLQRGVIAAEGTLDLHGMRVREAGPALVRFLAFSRAKGWRCIRIVHGKGRGSAGQQPVLKQKTNQWLQQRDEVLAFCTAPRWDGGTGAAYVLLSRRSPIP